MINFLGDICYSDGFFDVGFGIGSQLKEGLDPLNRVHIDESDFYIANFECVSSNFSDNKSLAKDYFRIAPEFLNTSGHVNLYCVANNHIMQHGERAFYETIDHIQHNSSSYVGTLDKKHVAFYHNNYSVGIVNFSFRIDAFSKSPLYWHNPDLQDINLVYSHIKGMDLRVAYIHWGHEYMNYPSYDQRNLGRYLIDMGFSLVVGVHSHVLQGYEKYKDGYIFYSLGNFVFNMENDICRRSAVLKVDLNKNNELVIDYDYIKINGQGFPERVKESDVPFKFKFEYLNQLISYSNNEEYFVDVYKSIRRNRFYNYFFIVRSLHKYKLSIIFKIFFDFIKRRFL